MRSPFLDAEVLSSEALRGSSSARAWTLRLTSPYLQGAHEGERLIEEQIGVIDGENRAPVPDTLALPFRWICSIAAVKLITHASGRTSRTGLAPAGTGVLISPRHVLTAAHVLRSFERDTGERREAQATVAVKFARDGTNAPLGEFEAASWRLHPHWNPDTSGAGHDLALITLNRSVGGMAFAALSGRALRWWGADAGWSLDNLPPAVAQRLLGAGVLTAGYPESANGTMMSVHGTLHSGSAAEDRALNRPALVEQWARRSAVFTMTADATKGQSGSPVWLAEGANRYLLGIVATAGIDRNQIKALDGQAMRLLQQWIAEDAPRGQPRIAPKVQRRITLEVPHRWVCRLKVRDNDRARAVGYGTGLLISDRHVLTSAGVIHGFARDRRRYSIRVAPGYEFGKVALGSIMASLGRVPDDFSPGTNDAAADFGLLTLSRPLGRQRFAAIRNLALGHWGGESHGLAVSEADWSGKQARIAAFSRESGGGGGYHKLRLGSGASLDLQRGEIHQKASSKLDAPGAPIWVEAGSRRLLVGVTSGNFVKDSGVNRGCYLSPQVRDRLMLWINADYEGESRALEAEEEALRWQHEESGETDDETPEAAEFFEADMTADAYEDAELDTLRRSPWRTPEAMESEDAADDAFLPDAEEPEIDGQDEQADGGSDAAEVRDEIGGDHEHCGADDHRHDEADEVVDQPEIGAEPTGHGEVHLRLDGQGRSDTAVTEERLAEDENDVLRASEWAEPAFEFDTPPARWQDAVFRAIFAGERRVLALLKAGRDASGADARAVRATVLKLLRLPFPSPAQTGGVVCEKNVRRLAAAMPDRPKVIFTGRYESKKDSGIRYFWAINQAGNTVIAIRTMRGFSAADGGKASKEYRELRGDVQADGTAVLFQADAPERFWGYLQLQPNRSIKWHDGSYLGTDGKRVVVDGNPERDEVLQLSADNRPTMMMSLYKSDDNYLSVLLQQREWYPLTPTRYEFLQEGARADLLRDLLTTYLRTPEGITYREKQAKGDAAGRVANYVAHLLWNGDRVALPGVVSNPPQLQAHAARARRLFPHGHHNNAVLATHVAKIWLAHEKLNHAGEKRSFLDWLTKLAQDRQDAPLAKLLDVPLDPARAAGQHRYRMTLTVATGGFFIGYAEGILRVEKLNEPKWPGGGAQTYDVTAGTLGKPKMPTRDEVFDLVVTTAQEWMPDDFEGTLWLGEVTASAGITRVTPGVTVMGGYLRSKNGPWIAFEDADAFVKPRGGKPAKPKLKVRAEGMAGTVRRRSSALIDLSRPYSASTPVAGNLLTATHFCFGSSLLTPAGRQLLRVVCADQLAALASTATQITITGHTDRPDTGARNQELSMLRAQNVKAALTDILGDARKVPDAAIQVFGLGEWLAKFKLRPEHVRNPQDRRVDLHINGSLVVSFRE